METEVLAGLGTIVAALAAVLAVVVPVVRAAGRHGRYNRWLEIVEKTKDENQRNAARNRATFYFVEMTAADFTRSERLGTVFSSAFFLGVGSAMWAFGIYFGLPLIPADMQHDFTEIGWWPMTLVATIGGIYGLLFGSERILKRARRQIRVLLELPVREEQVVPKDWTYAWIVRRQNSRLREIDAAVTKNLLRDQGINEG